MQLPKNPERLREIDYVKAIQVGGYYVNIDAPFSVQPIDLGIPGCHYFDSKQDTSFSVKFTESEHPIVLWDAENTTVTVMGPSSKFKSGTALIFRAMCLTEYQRQREGKVLTHGAGVVSPEGKGILLLGNQGAGKTTLVLSLGMRGYSLVGNDQVIFGKSAGDVVELLEGTKHITVRQNIRRYNLPVLQSVEFPTNGRSEWDTKKVLCPNNINMQECTDAKPLNAVFLIHLDGLGTDKAGIKRLCPNDLQANLFLAEKFSRHITGVATPLLADDGNLLALPPSLDDEYTRRSRVELIEDL